MPLPKKIQRDGRGSKEQSPLPIGTAMPWARWRTPKSGCQAAGGCEHAKRWMQTYLIVTEGTLAGSKVLVHDFQLKILHSILCEGGVQIIVSMPRGNGKTSLMAMLAIYHAATQTGAKAIIVAVNEQQALIGYRQALDMVMASKALEPHAAVFRVNRAERIRFSFSAGEVSALPANVSGLQGLRPSLALVDECGFVADRVWSTMALGLGKHKGSRIVGWGTPGFDRGVMWRIREAAMKPDAPASLVYHEIAAPAGAETDPYRESYIRAANPAIRAGFLDFDVVMANAQTETRQDFLTFRLAIWADREEAYLASSEWNALLTDTELPPAGSRVQLGFDGSVGGKQRDTTALVGAYGDRVFVLGYWAPPEGKAGEGWKVPRAEVMARIDELLQEYTGELHADPWYWRAELQELTDRYGDRVIEQNTGSRQRFGPMADRFRVSVQTGVLVHDGSEVLRDHALAAVALPTNSGVIVVKDMRLGERQSIDMLTAAILAHQAAADVATFEIF